MSLLPPTNFLIVCIYTYEYFILFNNQQQVLNSILFNSAILQPEDGKAMNRMFMVAKQMFECK